MLLTCDSIRYIYLTPPLCCVLCIGCQKFAICCQRLHVAQQCKVKMGVLLRIDPIAVVVSQTAASRFWSGAKMHVSHASSVAPAAHTFASPV